ncbi:MAG TPA: RNA 2',3'-cyclic phosphodiesterase [Candidatus Acidoferrales bacterium]|nr:RNA 2',3'-cyclic phosphodiesterase [Candidatus Acidoferrales bacterium]
MRLFVALDVPDETRRALDETVRQFEAICRGARWTRAESVHVTLKFIGHVEETMLPAIKESLSKVKSKAPLEIAFGQFGFFPNERRPRVLWLGIEPGPILAVLASQIASTLEAIGIPREERDFKPHLTLARFKTEEGLAKLRQMVASLANQSFGCTVATEFHLYESMLNPRGAVHTKLASYRFAEGSATP